MIKVDELREYIPQVRYENGDAISLQAVQRAIEESATKFDIPVAFKNEQVKSGGLFKSSVEDCVIMYHPEHEKDYFNFVIRIQRQGVYAYVVIDEYGQSKQLNKAYRSDLAKQGVKDYFKADAEDYNAIGRAIGQSIGGALGSIGKSKKKLEEEEKYYQIISEIFAEVVR